MKNQASEVPANRYRQPSKIYVAGFPHEAANNHLAVINSRGKKVVLRNISKKTAFVTRAAL